MRLLREPQLVKKYLKIPETVNEKPSKNTVQPIGIFKAIFLGISLRTNVFKGNTHDKMNFI